ncbi:hypothetical protein D3C77_523350 [compost metagenome]
MKSATQSWLGRSAVNCRFTKSLGLGLAGSDCVVFTVLPRVTPRSPISRISRSSVQRTAHRLDPELLPMRVDKTPDHFKRRSSSAWAKKALATLSISLARLSSRTSRSSSLMRGSVAVLGAEGEEALRIQLLKV